MNIIIVYFLRVVKIILLRIQGNPLISKDNFVGLFFRIKVLLSLGKLFGAVRS